MKGRTQSTHTQHLPLLLRTECIVMDQEATLERVAGGWLMLTGNNPGYWWGNALFMDRAPEPEDLLAWPEAFRRLVHQRQPASRHMAFGWEGNFPGIATDFTALGFNFFSLMVLSATHPIPCARATKIPLELRAFQSGDWPLLVKLMVDEQAAVYRESDFQTFAELRVEQWRCLAGCDQGGWFGAFDGKELVGAVGLYVESEADSRGQRLARFQNVLTAARWQRRGIASALLTLAANAISLRYAPSQFVIQAIRDSAAERLYGSLGYQPVSHAFGLELSGAA
jgi:GNAT superfamily N-acetyltransferase